MIALRPALVFWNEVGIHAHDPLVELEAIFDHGEGDDVLARCGNVNVYRCGITTACVFG